MRGVCRPARGWTRICGVLARTTGLERLECTMFEASQTAASNARVWQVGALCRAIADAMDARFNPVTVAGEISGFTRAASGALLPVAER